MSATTTKNSPRVTRYTFFIVLVVGAELGRIGVKIFKNWDTINNSSVLVTVLFGLLITALLVSRYFRIKKKAEEMRVAALINQAAKESTREYQESQVTRSKSDF